MNPELRQRLIGAVVVTALAAIFIPMLFDVPVDNNSPSVTELGIPATAHKPNENLTKKLPSNTKQVLKPSDTEPEDQNETEDEPDQSLRPSASVDTEIVDDVDTGTEELTEKKTKKSLKQNSTQNPLASTGKPYDEEATDERPLIEPADESSTAPLDTGVVEEVIPTKKSVKMGSKQLQASRSAETTSRDNITVKEDKNKQTGLTEKAKPSVKLTQLNTSKQTTVKSDETDLPIKTRLSVKSTEISSSKPTQLEAGIAIKSKVPTKTIESKTPKQFPAYPGESGITVKTKPPIKNIIPKQQATIKLPEAEQLPKNNPPVQIKKTEVTPTRPTQTILVPTTVSKIEKPAKTDTEAKPLPELMRWYVHVGSFSQKENAFSLLESLNQQGLPVILETIKTTNKGSMYRIKIGPELDKKRADAIKTKLDKQNIKANVIAN